MKTLSNKQGYKTAITDFPIFYILTLKINKSVFKISPYKLTFFQTIDKTGICVIVLLVYYQHAEFELDNFIFGKVMANILLNIDDVKYSNSIFFFLPLCTAYKKTKNTIGFPVMSCIK